MNAHFCIQDTGDSDSEAEQERLAEYEAALRENAPDFVLDPDAAAEADNVSQGGNSMDALNCGVQNKDKFWDNFSTQLYKFRLVSELQT